MRTDSRAFITYDPGMNTCLSECLQTPHPPSLLSDTVGYPPESRSLDPSHDGPGHLRLCLGDDVLARRSGG